MGTEERDRLIRATEERDRLIGWFDDQRIRRDVWEINLLSI
jgi:hypothetical protein